MHIHMHAQIYLLTCTHLRKHTCIPKGPNLVDKTNDPNVYSTAGLRWIKAYKISEECALNLPSF